MSKEPVASLVNEDADSLLLRKIENNTASIKRKRKVLSQTHLICLLAVTVSD